MDTTSKTLGNGVVSAIITLGPYQHGSLLRSLTLYGEATTNLAAGLDVTIALVDRVPTADSEVRNGDLIARTFTVVSGSFFTLPLQYYKRILSKRIVAVLFEANNSAASYVCGVNAGVMAPIILKREVANGGIF